MEIPKVKTRRTAFISAPIVYAVFITISWALLKAAPVKQNEILTGYIVLGSIVIFVFLIIFSYFVKIIMGGAIADSYTVIYFILSSFCFLICQLFMFGVLYKATGLVSTRAMDNTAYLYFSTMTLATVGYGDIIPSDDARIIVVIHVLLGYLYLGVFLGLTTSMISQINEDNR